jgi:endonuclease IV
MAVCLDSAHLFSGGMIFRAKPGGDLLGMERHAVLPLVRMWHLNDSGLVRSRVDRHFHIGEEDRPCRLPED